MKECAIYPGEYVPMPETEALMNDPESIGSQPAGQPLVNMNELQGCYTMEMIIPGAKREDVLIYIHDNILSILVFDKHSGERKKNFQIHEFNSGRFERHIVLPDSADPEFISAKYRQGLLSVHIPKSDHPLKTSFNKIAIY